MPSPVNKRGLVPKLRFPEFRDAGKWTNALLGKLLIGSPDYGVNAAAVPFTDNLPKYLRITDISEGGQYLPDNQVSVDLDATDENYLDEGDIVLARTGASVGKSYRYRKDDGKLVFAGFLIRVKPDPRLLISTYLANFLTTDQFWKWIAVTSARSGQPGVNSTEYSSLAIPLPPKFSEQQKIADCLASLDEWITLEAQKLDTLKIHKKGLMQQLFPAEGKTLPKLRFPEFREAGEWRSEFGDVLFDQISNKDHNSDLPVLAITQEQGAIPRNLIDYHVSVTEKSIESYKVVEVGDFIISLRSFQGGIEYSSYKGICSPAYVILRLKAGYSADYFKHFLKTSRFIALLTKNLEGLRDGKMVSYKQFSELQLPAPHLNEQQRIADCLASLDDLITAQTQKLTALKTHKKGLMQQLFPVLDEATQ
jgi:type I restriction enzyme S subunit